MNQSKPVDLTFIKKLTVMYIQKNRRHFLLFSCVLKYLVFLKKKKSYKIYYGCIYVDLVLKTQSN